MSKIDKSYVLSEEERQRFMYWLEKQIESGKGILLQFEKLSPMIAQAMTEREKRKILGYMIVLEDLQNSESFSVKK